MASLFLYIGGVGLEPSRNGASLRVDAYSRDVLGPSRGATELELFSQEHVQLLVGET